MSEERIDVDKIFAEGTPIDEALRRAASRAVLEHKRERLPIAVWRDGKVTWITPRESRIATNEDGDDNDLV